MKVSTLFFDLESSLYPISNGLNAAIEARINLFMGERLGLSRDQIPQLLQTYIAEYDTTIRGLQANFEINQWDYLRFIYDIPLSDYLQHDPNLRDTLRSIPSRRWIFSNADIDHINRVLTLLGIDDCFEGIIDTWSLYPYCKPQKEAYQRALDITGIHDPRECIFLDNCPKNLLTAKEGGFFTVLVSPNGITPTADLIVKDIHNLKQSLPNDFALI